LCTKKHAPKHGRDRQHGRQQTGVLPPLGANFLPNHVAPLKLMLGAGLEPARPSRLHLWRGATPRRRKQNSVNYCCQPIRRRDVSAHQQGRRD
jgi:hypothetical protein